MYSCILYIMQISVVLTSSENFLINVISVNNKIVNKTKFIIARGEILYVDSNLLSITMGDMLRIMLTLIIIFAYSDRCFYCWFIIMDTSDCHSKTNTHLYIKVSLSY